MSQIIQGDALQVLPTFPEGCVDVVVTSPRYNFGKNYPGVPDNTPMDVYMDEMFDLAQALDRVIHPTGVLFLNVGTRAADPLHDVEVCQRFLQATFPRELVIRCLRLVEWGKKGLRVLDPCCGTGTVPIVAVEQGHIGVGIDLSPEMAQEAASALAEAKPAHEEEA